MPKMGLFIHYIHTLYARPFRTGSLTIFPSSHALAESVWRNGFGILCRMRREIAYKTPSRNDRNGEISS